MWNLCKGRKAGRKKRGRTKATKRGGKEGGKKRGNKEGRNEGKKGRREYRDLKNLKSIFLSNGYPGRLLDKLFCSSSNNTDNFIGPQKCPVYLKLPWIGQIAETHYERELKNITEKTFRSAKLRCIFSTRTILAPTPKDSLPAFSTSSVIYEFKCECDSRYVGRTSQRLGDRVKQHIPSTIRNQTLPMRKQPGRKCRQNQEIECDSAIGKHLLMNKSCADAYSDAKFRILQKCRSTFSLKTMEAIFIKLNDPVLCRQKQFVFQLALFWWCLCPTKDEIITLTFRINTGSNFFKVSRRWHLMSSLPKCIVSFSLFLCVQN